MLLDVALGEGPTGHDVAAPAARRRDVVPIIMLTALDSEADAVQGLEAGADDYVTKPFGLAELRSRIRAVLRRAQGRVVEGAARSARSRSTASCAGEVDGGAVRLTFSEFELLACLMGRPGRAFNRQELLRAIWGDSAYRDPRAIDVHIRHLREKLEERPEQPSLILTVPRHRLPLPRAMRRASRPSEGCAAAAAGAGAHERGHAGRGRRVVLGPLQQRLRDQSTDSLRAAVLAARPRFEVALARRGSVDREIALSSEAFELSDRPRGACSSPTSR